MTPQEAIKIIEIAIAEVEWEYPMEYTEAFEIAIRALEKQILKKVIFMSDKSKVCGSCKQRVLRHQPYCEYCGQALDWSEDAE